jgi:jasmonate ZIM domain-containing protein
LTIFYNGSVNVFDNVPVEKVCYLCDEWNSLEDVTAVPWVYLLIVFQLRQAKELMMLASRASIPSPPSAPHKPDSPISAPAKVNVPEVLPARQIVIQKPEPSVPHVSTTSSPVPVVPQVVALSRNTSNCTIEPMRPKPAVQMPVTAPTSQAMPVTAATSQAPSSQPMPLATTSAAVPRGIISTCLQFIWDMLGYKE